MEPITIVVSCDNHYLVLLAALVKSIETNISGSSGIDLYIIEDRVNEVNKLKLEQGIEKSLTTIHWKKLTEVMPQGVKLPLDKSSYPLNIYMRLFVPYIVSEHVQKALYLDVDMIVQSNIADLFNIDLGENIVGAALDSRIKTFDSSWGGISNYRELGLNAKTKYFNTGLLLINLKRWREKSITEKVIECVNENLKNVNFPDQYGLNVVLADQWLEISQLWNYSADGPDINPYLIHFNQRKPIYETYTGQVSFRKTFYNYLKLTEWKDFTTIGEPLRYFKKIRNILFKLKQRLSS